MVLCLFPVRVFDTKTASKFGGARKNEIGGTGGRFARKVVGVCAAANVCHRYVSKLAPKDENAGNGGRLKAKNVCYSRRV